MIVVSPLLPLAIEIGFTQARIKHNETGAQFSAVLKKDRPSEQTFFIQIQLSTPRMQRVGEPATAFPSQPVDFTLANFTLGTRTVIFALTPADNGTELEYTIFEDNIPENTEIFQLSAAPDPNTLGNPDFDCDDDPMFRFNGHDCFPDLQVLILDDDGELLLFLSVMVIVKQIDLNRGRDWKSSSKGVMSMLT